MCVPGWPAIWGQMGARAREIGPLGSGAVPHLNHYILCPRKDRASQIALSGDERLDHLPARHGEHTRRLAGQFDPGVFENLVEPLRLPAPLFNVRTVRRLLDAIADPDLAALGDLTELLRVNLAPNDVLPCGAGRVRVRVARAS